MNDLYEWMEDNKSDRYMFSMRLLPTARQKRVYQPGRVALAILGWRLRLLFASYAPVLKPRTLSDGDIGVWISVYPTYAALHKFRTMRSLHVRLNRLIPTSRYEIDRLIGLACIDQPKVLINLRPELDHWSPIFGDQPERPSVEELDTEQNQ